MLKVARKKMACWLSLFRKKNKTKQTPGECSSQHFLELEKLLGEQAEKIEKQIEECVETAKANSVTKKRVAIRALHKKSYLETKLQLLDKTLTTLEQQRDAIENAEINKAVLDSVKCAGETLKKAKKKLKINKMTTLMDESKDQHESGITGAIQKLLEEEELEKELNDLIQADSYEISIETQLEKLPAIMQDLDNIFISPNQRKLLINPRDIHTQ